MVNKLIKKVLGVFYSEIILPLVYKVNKKISSKIPKNDLGEKNIRNAKFLTNRQKLLDALPKNGIVGELGVDEGDFSELILNICKPKKLHLIDFWETKRYNNVKREGVEKRFSKYIKEKSVEINLGLSTEVVGLFEDHYFDWIYIDTDHSYKTTIRELEAYRNKVKRNGILAGHDYILGNWDRFVRYGVIEAVHEFCGKYNWEILYITSELTVNPSFAIRQITGDDNEKNY